MSNFWFLNTLIGRKIFIEKPEGSSTPSENFFELSSENIHGDFFKFDQLKGKKTLIVNTASECGFTNQYFELENFYRNFSDQVNLIAFPCNDFGRQEPGSSEEISNFCKERFDISFPLMKKIKVKGSEKSSVYQWLTAKSKNGWNEHAPHWNFCKYLINEDGELILVTNPVVKPTDDQFLSAVLTK